MADKGLCSFKGCGKQVRSAGLCEAHYKRQWRHGDAGSGGIQRGQKEPWLRDHVGHTGDACLIWPFTRLSNGYGYLRLNGKMTTASRFMCELVNGPPPEPWYEAAHTCGAGHNGCVHPGHLAWKTPSKNRADKVAHGTHNRGSQNHRAKLTEQQVLEIRALDGKEKLSSIARRYGVRPNVVSQIMSRAVWAWL